MELAAEIADSVQKGKASRVKELVLQAVAAGAPPLSVIDQGLLGGMAVVSQKFRNNEVFIPEVLIAARAMNAGLALLRPLLAEPGAMCTGRVVIGTVQGDLHDLGKNLVKTMMEARGIEVVDLGVDVPAARFAQAARDRRADIVACSALLATTLPEMRKVAEALDRAGLRGGVKLMVGGAPVTEPFSRALGADAWSPNAVGAAQAALQLLASRATPSR